MILKSAPAGGKTPATPETIAKIIADALNDAIAPLAKRIEAVETAHQLKTGRRPGGQVRKADGEFSWEGSHLLN